jgi:ribonuclease E
MAKRKIIISEYDNIAALMEDDRAIEFIIHRGDMLLGDVYLATVENILPSIDAAFVNVGGDKMGFLHSSDVPGKGDLKDRLEPKQQLVVQIMKEPTGHKGPRVSTNISLPGRFLVMMPESKGISISRKIVEQAERSRLKSIVSLIKPPGVGVIIRTEAANQKESDITEDFETLLERWQNIVSMADTATPPTLLYRDQDLLYRVIREAVTEDVTEIIVDSAFGQQRAQQLLQNWNMDKGIKVTHYQGNQSILVGTGVDKEIKLALQTKVPLPSGGYLYIQPTEALTVIDVNSGKFTSLQSQAETIKLTNLEACKEIARQLRLRNIGGMIIVDFIDMESRAHQLTVLQTFENELAPDKAKPQIGQLSDLGLVEMTRHRQGQSLSEIFTRRCNVCNGTGHALEEFSWMHVGDSERNRPGRNKLPVRQPSRHQQVPKPAASVNRNKSRVIGQLAENAEAGKEKQVQSNVTPGNILLNSLSDKKQEADNLVEFFSDKLYKVMGVKLAHVAKLSWIPIPVNSVLSRINPKANDVVTLVRSIEAAAAMPVPEALPAALDDEFEAEEELEETEAQPEVAATAATEELPTPTKEEADELATESVELATDAPPLTVPDEEVETDEIEEVEVAVAVKPRRGRLKKQEEAPPDVVEIFQPDEEEEPVEAVPEFLADTMEESAEAPEEAEEAGDAQESTVVSAVTPPKRRGGRPQKRTVKKSAAKR